MWTPEYFVRLVPLPATIDGLTIPNDDGTFDVYINASHCEAKQQESLAHEIKHIMEDHFYQDTKAVAQLEQEASASEPAPPPPARLPNVFEEYPPGTIPLFSSLSAFGNYMFAMREQTQADLQPSAS